MVLHSQYTGKGDRGFRDIFQRPGRDFGSPSRGALGISDGNEGVQWNAGYYPRDGAVWRGVNLEGMKYDGWPVARLIEREISRPLLLTRYRPPVARPDKVTVLWSRPTSTFYDDLADLVFQTVDEERSQRDHLLPDLPNAEATRSTIEWRGRAAARSSSTAFRIGTRRA
ncbi:MAG: hypothetical protein F4043_01665 [Gammaproteobacteria bacterium]|nr:hypothetical protein [Gammaproteobacteria bacterium]